MTNLFFNGKLILDINIINMPEFKETSIDASGDFTKSKEAWMQLEKKYQNHGLGAEYRKIIENILSAGNKVLKDVIQYQADSLNTDSVKKFIESLIFDEGFIKILEDQAKLDSKEQIQSANLVVKETYSAYKEIQEASDALSLVVKNFQELRDNPEKSYQEGYDINISDLINKKITAIIGLQDMMARYPQARTEKYQKRSDEEKEKLSAILVGLERLAG